MYLSSEEGIILSCIKLTLLNLLLDLTIFDEYIKNILNSNLSNRQLSHNANTIVFVNIRGRPFNTHGGGNFGKKRRFSVKKIKC